MSIFYSGFSLKEDRVFFQDLLDNSEYTLAGFSYGAIVAFKEAQKKVLKGERIDRLQLFSPAFFQTKSNKFKKLQLLGFKKNKKSYIQNFLKGCFTPYKIDTRVVIKEEATIKELELLLEYEWIATEVVTLQQQGVVIEVYLGSEDKIIDVVAAREFFKEVTSLSYIQEANHFLQTKKGE